MTVLAIDIGGTEIKYGLVNESGELLCKDKTETEASRGVEALLQKLYTIAEEYTGKYERIGISTTGQVNEETGTVVYATDTIPGYAGIELGTIMREKFGCPTSVENDVNCAAIAEAAYGAGVGLDSFLCLTYGTGIGGAIFENGSLFHGAHHVAGEFGHIRIHAGGRPCNCGGSGCYEEYASTTALVERVEKVIGRKTDGREIFSPVLRENPAVEKELNAWIDEIAIGLVGLVYIFNPAAIILGGGIMQETYLVEEVSKRVKAQVMPPFRAFTLVPAKLGNTAGMRGAAYLALQL